MKVSNFQIIRIIIIVFSVLSLATSVYARKDSGYITVNGVVKDIKSKKKLEQASISIQGTGIGTVSNEDGVFSIKVKDSLQTKVLEVSHLGYFNQKLDITDNTDNVTIFLTPNEKSLKEVVIQSADPLKLVEIAISKIGNNNSNTANLLTGFYRETLKKRRNYIGVTEAVVDVYKTPYDQDVSGDKVQVLKGRKLLSPNPGDTLLVKFIGGPTLSTYLDIVKNKDLVLDKENLHCYKFTMEKSVMINERPHFVVSFKPQVVLPDALFNGTLYIDQETLAFSRAELNLSMDDKNKATRAILYKKPFRLHFKPEEVSFIITYKEQDGKSYLNYVRNEVRFKCDYKRRLFSTNYTIVSEMVVTDRKEDNISKIPSKQAFNERYSLSDKVNNFHDIDFWENYNIIEPAESLESAVNKLKKQHDK